MSARSAGITTLVTVNEYTGQQDFTGAAIVLSQLGEPEEGFEVVAGHGGTASFVNIGFLQWILSCAQSFANESD
jgi:hypothetical protein